jgi:hypothetical protein
MSTASEVDEVSNGKTVITVQTSSSRTIKKSSFLTNITRPSSPRQFFARLYGNLETSGSNTTPAETTR